MLKSKKIGVKKQKNWCKKGGVHPSLLRDKTNDDKKNEDIVSETLFYTKVSLFIHQNYSFLHLFLRQFYLTPKMFLFLHRQNFGKNEKKIFDLPRTRTWNLLLRRQTRYPLRQKASYGTM